MPSDEAAGRTALAIALTALAYVLGLGWMLRWDVGVAPVAAAAALVALWRWGRHIDRAGPRLGHAAVPLAALYAVPFARLAFWNAQYPITRAFHMAPWALRDAFRAAGIPENAAGLQVAAFLARVLMHVMLPAAVALVPLAFGGLVYLAARRVALHASPASAAVLAVAALTVAAVTWPVACDTHESFEDVPNARCTCEGFVASYYPPGWFDAGSTDYCIGIERPAPPPR